MNTVCEIGTECAVEVGELRRVFKKKAALDGVSFTVRPGRVFGLVGENGAGKTTFMKLLLGLLRPTSGTVRVFGEDPVANPEGVLANIGYLSEDRDIPGWMRVGELMAYTKAFYPGWDDAYADELLDMFQLDRHAKIKTLSRGEKAKAGLLAALAYRPGLLLLDEPSSGLDAIARRDILGAIIRAVADEGRTVILSSHLLDEVDRVADDIVMLREGKVVLSGTLDEIRAAHARFAVRFETPCKTPPACAGVLHWEGASRDWTAFCGDDTAASRAAIEAAGGTVTGQDEPSLEDIFVTRAGVARAAFREE
mgnify:CR=1 FL=1